MATGIRFSDQRGVSAMAVSPLSAAKKLCEHAGWKLTNLHLQKILYIAHMVFWGKHNRPLLDQTFEAWNYGPVQPSVYHRVKSFGSLPIKNVFHGIHDVADGPEAAILEQAAETLADIPAGKLVEMTHWKDGAWAKHFRPGRINARIPDVDVLEEYRARFGERERV